MPGMMSDADWQSYRDTARQQTANMNAMPYVFDPAAMSPDRDVNQQALYGIPRGADANLSNIVSRAFRDFFGHAPSTADMQAWMSGAAQHGLNAQQLYDGIGAAARTMGNSGQAAAATDTTLPATGGFQQGMMANLGIPQFGAGIMSYK